MTTAAVPQSGAATITAAIRSVELEITGTCQLQCTHCCTESGPKVSAGSMSRSDWEQVISDIAGLGIPSVQFIGGEPTLSPYLPKYIDHALTAGLQVEVYSNLAHVRPALWSAFERPGVCLATSYYSDRAEEHEQITNGPGSFKRTRANIPGAQLLLQAADLPAQRGLGDVQRFGGPAEVAVLGDGREVPDQAQIEVGHAGSVRRA